MSKGHSAHTSSCRTTSIGLGTSTPKSLAAGVVFSSQGGPTSVALSNSWIVINSGGGPTDDKPNVIRETPGDPNRVHSFVNIRVKSMDKVYPEWSARGAQFLTPPKQHQHEIRCYIRDPDGHLIEVGQHRPARGLDARSLAIESSRRDRARGRGLHMSHDLKVPTWD